jgi:antitoxin component YwqK of YwqJK toxin-antitoxin module
MVKSLLTLLFGLTILQASQAQKNDSTIYYFKKSGRQVDVKDSADYYQIILPPDTSKKEGLYRVYDYYPDGKTKRVATSLNASINLALDGVCTDYYPNGKVKIKSKFKEGRLIDTMFFYYPNGKLYTILNIQELTFGHFDDTYRFDKTNFSFFHYLDYHYQAHVNEMRDSTGNVLVKNGTGHAIIFDDDEKIIVQGDLKSDKKEGDWTGPITDSGKFVCTYRNNELKSGISYINSGHQYPFKKFVVNPIFSDGEEAFLIYVKKNIQYSEFAKKANPKGIAKVSFYVETDGRVTNVMLTESVLKSLDDELVRVVASSPLWIPASRFGIPIRSQYIFRFNYNSQLW